MVERRGGLGFLEEPLLGGVVLGQIRRQELDGHRALEAWVTSLIHDAHAALAKLADDGIRAEGGTGLEGHGGAEYIAGLSQSNLLRLLGGGSCGGGELGSGDRTGGDEGIGAPRESSVPSQSP